MSAPEPLAHRGAGDAFTVTPQARSLVLLMARKGKAEAVAAAVKAMVGLDLPPAGRWSAVGAFVATWLQPGGWLLEAPAEPSGAFQAGVVAAVDGLASAVDQSHGRSLLRLAGPQTRRVLATLCRLDFHPRAFAAGSAASTLVAHVPCVIRALEAEDGFDLAMGSTYARWLTEDLLEASAACGGRLLQAEGGAPASFAPGPASGPTA